MKRLILTLIVLFTAATLFAGDGKSCDTHKAKNVQLQGTITTNAEGAKIFRVSDGATSYTLCHKTKADVLKLGESGATIAVKGKLVSCDEAEGEELVIEAAKKI